MIWRLVPDRISWASFDNMVFLNDHRNINRLVLLMFNFVNQEWQLYLFDWLFYLITLVFRVRMKPKAIFTLDALASISTGDASFETFTVTLLTITLLAIATRRVASLVSFRLKCIVFAL